MSLLVGLVTLVCVTGALLAIELDEVDVAFVFAACAATVPMAAVFVHEYRRSRNSLSPLCLSVLVMFFLYPFHGMMTRESPNLLSLLGADAEVWRTRALLVVAAAVPMLWLGFNSRWGRPSARPSRLGLVLDDEHQQTRVKLLALYFAAALPRLALVATGEFFRWSGERAGQDFQFLLTVLSTIPTFVTTFFLVLGWQRKQRLALLIGLAMLAGELLWGLLSGSRVRMFAPLLAAVAAVSYLGRPLALRRMLVILVVFAIVAFPFVTAFRDAYYDRTGDFQREGMQVSTMVDVLSQAVAESDESRVTDGDGPLELIADRLHGLTSLALIMRYTPERHDYLWGVPYLLLLPQVLIPRAIWPDKPPVAPLHDAFRFDYWGIEPGSATSVAISQLGDLWANLHIVGILLGTYFYGAFIAFISRRLRFGLAAPSILPAVVFAVLLPDVLHGFESSLDGVLSGFLKTIFVYLLVAFFLSKRGHRAPS